MRDFIFLRCFRHEYPTRNKYDESQFSYEFRVLGCELTGVSLLRHNSNYWNLNDDESRIVFIGKRTSL